MATNKFEILVQAKLDEKVSLANIKSGLKNIEAAIAKNPIKVSVTVTGAQAAQTQMNNVTNAVKNMQKITKDSSKINVNLPGNSFSNLQNRLKDIKKNVDALAKVEFKTNAKGQIEQAFITYHDQVGRAVRETMGWVETVNKAGQVTKKTFKTTGFTYTNDVAKANQQLQASLTTLERYRTALQRIKTTYDANSGVKDAARLTDLNTRYNQIIQTITNLESKQTKLSESQRRVITRQIEDLRQLAARYRDAEKTAEKGFNFKQYTDVTGTMNKITTASQAYNTSLLQGHKLISSNVQETQQYLKVTQQLQQGNYMKNVGVYIDKATGKMYQFNSSLRNNLVDTITWEKALTTAFKRIVQWTVAGGLFFNTFRFFREGITYVIELNKALTEISIVTMRSQEDVAKLGQEYAKLAKQMSVTTTEIAKGAVEFYRQGLNEQQTMERLRQTTIYSKISNLEFAESAKIITATVNSMGISANKAIDTFAFMGDATATGADEIGRAFQKVGGTASALNVDFDKVSSWIAVVSAKTREGAETIGQAMKSIMARYQSLKEKGFDEEDGTKVNQVAKALAEAGILMVDAQGQFRNFGTVMDELGSTWDTLDSRQKAYIATTLAGTYQQSRFLNLMNGYRQSVDLYQESLTKTGIAQEKYNLWLQGTEAHLNRLKVAGTDIFSTVFNSEGLRTAIDALTGILTALNNLMNAFGSLNTIVVLVTGSLALFTTTGRALANNLAMSVPFVNNMQTSLTGYIDKKKMLIASYRQEIEALKTGTATAITYQNVNGKMVATSVSARTAIAGLRTSLIASTVAMGAATVAAVALQTVLTMGLSVAITALISGITWLINKMFNARQEQQKMMEESAKRAQELGQELQNSNQGDQLIKQYQTLREELNNQQLSAEQLTQKKEKLKEIEQQLLTLYPDVIKQSDLENDALREKIPLLQQVNNEKKKTTEAEIKLEIQKAETQLNSWKNEKAQLEEERKEQDKTYNQSFDRIQNYLVLKQKLETAIERNSASIYAGNQGDATGIISVMEEINSFAKTENRYFDNATQFMSFFEDLEKKRDKAKKNLDSTKKDLELLQKNIDAYADNKLKMSEVYSQFINSMEAFNKVAKPTTEEIKEQITNLQNLKAAAQKSGLDGSVLDKFVPQVDQAIAKLNQLTTQVTQPATTQMQSFKDIVEDLTKSTNVLSTAWDEMNDAGHLSVKTVGDLLDTYPDLIDQITIEGGVIKINGQILKSKFDMEKQLAIQQIKIETDRLEALRLSTIQQLGFSEQILKSKKDIMDIDLLLSQQAEAQLSDLAVQKAMEQLKKPDGTMVENWTDVFGETVQKFHGELSQTFKSDWDTFNDNVIKAGNIIEQNKKRISILNALDIGNINDKAKKSSTSNGAEFDQKYVKEYLAEVEKVDRVIQQLQSKYSYLKDTNADIIEQHKILNQLIQEETNKQNALHDAAEKMRGKKADLEKTMFGMGINPNKMTQDQIETAYNKLSKTQKKTFLESYNDWKELVSGIHSAQLEWSNLQKEKAANAKIMADENAKLADNLKSQLVKALEQENDLIDKALEKKYEQDKELLEHTKDTYEKIFDIKKSTLEKEKDLLDKNYDKYEYSKELEKKKTELTQLQTERSKIASDNSGFFDAQRIELDKKIQDKRDEISDYVREHEINNEKDAIDTKIDALEEEKKQKEAAWDEEMKSMEKAYNDRAEKTSGFYSKELGKFITYYDEIKTNNEKQLEELNRAADETFAILGSTMTNNMVNSQNQIIDYLGSNTKEYEAAGVASGIAMVEGFKKVLAENGLINPNDASVSIDTIIAKLKKDFSEAKSKNDVKSMLKAAQMADEVRKMVGLPTQNDQLIENLEKQLKKSNPPPVPSEKNINPILSTNNQGTPNTIAATTAIVTQVLKTLPISQVIPGFIGGLITSTIPKDIDKISSLSGQNVRVDNVNIKVDKMDNNTDLRQLAIKVWEEIRKMGGYNNKSVR
jgi:TP901 family phage tail tape measure protein